MKEGWLEALNEEVRELKAIIQYPLTGNLFKSCC